MYPIKLAERSHASDVTVSLMGFTHRNRRQPEMEVAVTAVLADVPSQLTARDVFGDCDSCQASNRAGGPPLRPQAVPTAPESLAAAGVI